MDTRDSTREREGVSVETMEQLITTLPTSEHGGYCICVQNQNTTKHQGKQQDKRRNTKGKQQKKDETPRQATRKISNLLDERSHIECSARARLERERQRPTAPAARYSAHTAVQQIYPHLSSFNPTTSKTPCSMVLTPKKSSKYPKMNAKQP